MTPDEKRAYNREYKRKQRLSAEFRERERTKELHKYNELRKAKMAELSIYLQSAEYKAYRAKRREITLAKLKRYYAKNRETILAKRKETYERTRNTRHAAYNPD